MTFWSAIAAVLLATFALAAGNNPDFRNIAREAGLRDVFPNGGNAKKRFIVETTGSGLAFIDYDNDGLPDLFVLSGEGGTNRMYHNEGHAKFRDVTAALYLQSSGWAQGACSGDFDNDGFTDLFVTYWGANRLYRNREGKEFIDVASAAGLKQTSARYNTGCAFLDIDNDGWLDLFVANYLEFNPAKTPLPGANPYCFYRGIAVACGPRGLPFERNFLYRNKRDGTFEDISQSSGIAEPEGHYSLGALTGDFNEDGLPDIYVACDQTPSLLYINKGNGKFEEEAVLRGVAFDGNGKEMSGMGADAADYTGDGRVSIFRTNFSDEFETLYRNRGAGNFDDVTLDAGLGGNRRYVGWGAGFFDFDNDGWKDLLLVNGHVFPEVDTLGIDIHFKDRAILYRNRGDGKFQDVSETAGPGVVEKHSARGAAFADIDNDGTLEIAINNQNEAPSLLKDAAHANGHWLNLRLIGTRSNRSAIGAKAMVVTSGHRQTAEVRSGGSYLSQNDLRLHFGLGPAAAVDEVQISWPSGRSQVLRKQKADQVLTVTEPH